MPIRVLVFGKPGDGAAYSAMGQLRALIRELRVDASVQIVTDPQQLKDSGIDATPCVMVDGQMISQGWVPSRNEILRAIKQRQEQLNAHNIKGPGGGGGTYL
jgi:hypothetical protein